MLVDLKICSFFNQLFFNLCKILNALWLISIIQFQRISISLQLCLKNILLLLKFFNMGWIRFFQFSIQFFSQKSNLSLLVVPVSIHPCVAFFLQIECHLDTRSVLKNVLFDFIIFISLSLCHIIKFWNGLFVDFIELFKFLSMMFQLVFDVFILL